MPARGRRTAVTLFARLVCMLAGISPVASVAMADTSATTLHALYLDSMASTSRVYLPDSANELGTEASVDSVARARKSYAILAALPVASLRTLDVRPLMDVVIGRRVQLTPAVGITFITGNNLLLADLPFRTYVAQIGVVPTGFGQGTVFTLGGAF